MTLRSGDKLGGFEILGLLGIGGMGEVYHARDLDLGREVAIKVLPERVADDENLLQRFEREARALAALNHHNIAGLHSVEREGETRFLVMEYVGGQTFQDRLHASPLSIDELLSIFAQIAEALEVAHERGIVHRDLKPANIKLTEDGRVKILDFGLAKALGTGTDSEQGGGTVALEPDPDLTAEGAIVGTLIYMSPEQARGRGIDKRTDIWAFGCMLFEALSGTPPFRGETGSDTIAQILEREPDWNLLPDDTPARIRELLWRCLQKDPRRRLRDIGEAWFGIQEHQSSSIQAPEDPPLTGFRRLTPRHLLLASIAALLVGVLAGTILGSGVLNPRGGSGGGETATMKDEASALPIRRFSIDMAATNSGTPVIPFFALSPDGSKIAYAIQETSRSGLFLRQLDRYEARFFAETSQVYAPFFDPSGQWIAMLRNRGNSLQLLKVSVDGGLPTQIAATRSGPQSGQYWGEDDLIVINPKVRSSLHFVSASGGELKPLLELDESRGEHMQLYPQVLPGGEAVLFTSVRTTPEGETAGGIEVLIRESGERRPVLEGAAFGRYIESGHLLYVPFNPDERPRHVAGAAFDVESFGVAGKTGTPVLNDVYIHPVSYLAHFDVARDGTLAYLPDDEPLYEVVWVSSEGVVETAGLPPRHYSEPRLSPEGNRIAVSIDEGTQKDVWIYDTARDSLSRLTLSGSSHSPLWRPDGEELIVAGGRDRYVNLFAVDADGSGNQKLLTRAEAFECPTSFSRDGSILTWATLDLRASSYNVVVGTPSLESSPTPYFDSPLWEMWPSISPDGDWVAFVSNRNGQPEVYIARYPGPGPVIQISNQGGTEPRWSHEGNEIYYRRVDSMMAVSIEPGEEPKVGVPRELFVGKFVAAELGLAHAYDVAPDGRFLMIRPHETDGGGQRQIRRLHIVLNWFEELNQLVPPPPST